MIWNILFLLTKTWLFFLILLLSNLRWVWITFNPRLQSPLHFLNAVHTILHLLITTQDGIRQELTQRPKDNLNGSYACVRTRKNPTAICTLLDWVGERAWVRKVPGGLFIQERFSWLLMYPGGGKMTSWVSRKRVLLVLPWILIGLTVPGEVKTHS